MKQGLYSLEPDDYFVLNGEMIEGRGEDSFYAACTPYTAVSAVFDGCGGIGSKKYSRFSGFSGAYMSSRAISGAMHDWFHDFDGGISLDSQEIGTTMKAYFRDAVKLLHRIGDEPSRIAGMLVRDFPSTAAVALVRKTEKGIELHCLWAGDSRIYLLDEQGLAQLTTDDIADRDAMHNLRADGALTNMVAADGNFSLHHRVFDLDLPAAVIAATDGCFGYLPTPMDFEDLILSALQEADGPRTFEDTLRREILEVTGDDYTLGFLCFGFGTFDALQKHLKKRKADLYREYIRPMQKDESEELAQELWNAYRENYLRFLEK
ncbi:MAG: protein phosphatase 2C domain-containing protein [Eubacteriales bacterium]|nr:protein phosphatase 2C domain-containing protein [Eubacteriales bacterium]